MRSVCILLFLFSFQLTLSQEDNIEQLLEQAENTVYSNPQEAIRIADYIYNKTKNPSQQVHASYLLTTSYYIEGKLNEAIKVGLKALSQFDNRPTETQLELYILLSKIMKELELNRLSEIYITNALEQSQTIPNKNIQDWLKGKSFQYKTFLNSEETSEHTFERLYKAKSQFNKIENSPYPSQIGNINLAIAAVHLGEFQLDSVPFYLDTAYSQSKKYSAGNYLEMKSLQLYGTYLFLQKQHTAAIDSLQSAMHIAEKFIHIEEQISISEAIADNYLALNNLAEFKNQNAKTQLLNKAQTDVENEAVNTAFNFIADDQLEQLANAKTNLRWNAIILGSILAFVLLLWSYLVYRYRLKAKQYKNYIEYFEKRKAPVSSVPTAEKTIKQTVVPKEMEKKILEKLNEFENSTEFTKQEISLSLLALQFETNTKYLSEIINFNKQKNFNAYINELRINYIIEKLKTEPTYLQYKISYLAQDSGFTSHSLFATVFKSVTGVPPTVFIEILKDKKGQSNSKSLKDVS